MRGIRWCLTLRKISMKARRLGWSKLNWLESILLAIEGLWANKMRALLTMLGIVIGIASVIAVVAIGQGGKAAITREMEKSGVNLFVVYVKSVGTETVSLNERLTLQDTLALKNSVSLIKEAVPSSIEYAE